MPDEQIPTLASYRYRGGVKPSAAVSRPAVARINATKEGGGDNTPTTATLDLFDVIDSWGGWWGISAREVDAALKMIGDVDTLYVRLNSPGGEATEGVAIANLLRAHKADVRITVYGLAASAASFIATAGDVVAMAPGTMMMVHSAWNIILGNAEELREEAAILDKYDQSIASLYVLKAGGTIDEWLDVMHAETWYTADDAVKAKLADHIGIDPQLPSDAGEVPDAVDAEKDDEPDSDPFDLATRRFDLSVFAHAPAASARTQTPAEPPETPPTETKEADAMSDTLIQGLRERFDLADDADEAAILAKADEVLEQATKPDPKPDDKPAAEPDAAAVAAALAKDGKVAVSTAYLDELKSGAEDGKAALARQRREDRDKAIAQAQAEGKIGRSEDGVKAWQAAWDRDPENTAKEIAALGVRFPVGPTQGIPGGEDGAASAVFTDAEAEALAQMSGVSKEALLS